MKIIGERAPGRPLLGARSPMIFIMKLGSIFAASAGSSGGNSTTSSAVPRSGGSAVGLAPLSSVNESGAGAASVTHSLADGVAPGSSVTRPSNSAIALSFPSSAVTTRRMSAAVALEHARTSATIEANILLVIASSFAVSANADWVTSNRSEEHTSELQSHLNLVCRLLLEKKKKTKNNRRD